MNKTIYIFGNPLLDFDNLPIKLMPNLQKTFPTIKFILKDPNENLHPTDGELIIIDTVEGVNEVRVFHDIDKIETSPAYSMHDLDLGFTLKLLKKIGTLNKVTIFCVPAEINPADALTQLTFLINTNLTLPSPSQGEGKC